MYKKLKDVLITETMFEDSNNQYWDDPYISQNLLKLHLEEYGDNASRNFQFLDQSVKFIDSNLKKYNLNQVIDFGCGPGLYCVELSKKGYEVTGLDFSKRSIDYAKEYANKHNLDINYLYQDYLNYNADRKYDLATLIYCDYGSLNKKNRATLLENIHGSLKPDGYFMMDVFSVDKFLNFKEQKTFRHVEDKSFWHDAPHLEFTIDESFRDFIALNKTVIVAEDELKTINRWYQYFTLDMLKEELEAGGFEVLEVYDDLQGTPHSANYETIAVLAKKL